MPLVRNFVPVQSWISQGWVTGQNLYYAIGAGNVHATVSQTYDILRLTPYIVPVQSTIIQIGIELIAASTDTGPVVFRIGVYNDTGSFYPGTLLLDTGGGINAKASPALLMTACNLTIGPGVYWFGGATQSASGTSAPPTIRSLSNIVYNIAEGTSAASAGSQYTGYSQSLGASSGALPTTFTTTRLPSATACVRINVQIK